MDRMRVAVLLAALVASGCGAARLEHAVRADGATGAAAVRTVQVLRQGTLVPPRLSMSFERGDEIETDADTTIILGFLGGTEIIVAPNTRVRISSLTVLFGEIYAAIRGLFEVDTDYVTAGVEGTQYWLRVERDQRVSIVVLDGRVRLSSRAGRWAPVSVGVLDAATVPRDGVPQRRRVEPSEVNRIVRWVNGTARGRTRASSLLVPSVLGLPEAEARAVLSGERVPLAAVQGRTTGQRPIGTVIDQQPPAGARLPLGGAVTLWVEAPAVRVPSVLGESIENAKAVLQRERLTVAGVRERITGNQPPGTVIDQQPPPGTVVALGSGVRLEVEGESATVPDIVGQSIDQARHMLAVSRLEVGTIREQRTGTAPAGTVLRHDPPPGARVGPGTRVHLVVESAGVLVPGVVGLPLAQAQTEIRAARLRVGRTSETESSEHEPGTVSVQSPPPGTVVEAGSTVDLVVSVVRERPQSPERTAPFWRLRSSRCTVPDVRGLTEDQAEAVLTNAGLTVARGPGQPVRMEGTTVSQQRPDPGTQARCGASVELWIGTLR